MELVARAEPALVTRARRRVADQATRCGASEDESLVIELLASELLTNAVVHGPDGGQVGVRARYAHGAFTVAVSDESTEAPVVRSPRLADVHGRGLRVVEGLAKAWGVVPEPGGKTVWFAVELERGHEPRPRHASGALRHGRVTGPDGLLNFVPHPRCP